MIDRRGPTNRLEGLLAELTLRQRRISADLAEPLGADSAERAVEMEDDAPLEAQAILVEQEIASVRRALDRLSDGSYGICLQCGGEIAPARLEARPEAALCIRCARGQD